MTNSKRQIHWFYVALAVGVVLAASVSYVPIVAGQSTHSPINIDGNAALAEMAASEGWPGDGSKSNPYQISNYAIDATGNQFGIHVSNTNAYFVIESCQVSNSSFNGIELFSVTNGTLRWNSCSNSVASGIYLESCSSCLVANNTCWQNGKRDGSDLDGGIRLQLSDNNRVTANVCYSSTLYHGMDIDSSNHNMIDNNSCHSNPFDGLVIFGGINNTIKNNHCYSNARDGIHLASSKDYLIGNNCTDNGYGIEVERTESSTIYDNVLYHNSYGLTLGSGNNLIWNNTIGWSTSYAISVGSIGQNQIACNKFIDNNGATSSSNGTPEQAYDGGFANLWNLPKMGNWWNDLQSPDSNDDGIVDVPYILAGVNKIEDHFPISMAMTGPLPGAPKNIQASPGDSKVSLTWSTPDYMGGSPVTVYVIYRNGFLLAFTGDTSYNDTGLTNGNSYSYYVRLFNGAGGGGASNSVSCMPRTVPGAPIDLTATPGNAQVSLAWSPPTSNGGVAIDYYVVYQNGIDIAHRTVTYYNKTNLVNGQDYSYYVKAHNSVGLGPQSNIASTTPVTFPGPPANLQATPGDSQVSLAWQVPTDSGGLSIINYLLYRSSAFNSMNITLNGTTKSFIDTGLVNGITCYYSISAQNSAGTGPAVNCSVMPVGIPPPPTNATAVEGDTSVTVSWSPPITNGGFPLTGYKIFHQEGAQTPTFIGSVGPNINSYADNTVERGKSYSYYLVATNQRGDSPPSTQTFLVQVHSLLKMEIYTDTEARSLGYSVNFTIQAVLAMGGSPISGIDVILYYSITSGATWNEISSSVTGADGNCSIEWLPTATGNFIIRASWLGDDYFLPAEAMTTLAITSSDQYYFTVQSNSTVSQLSFDSNSKQLSFTVSGLDGTLGYTRITISKQLVTDGASISISMDGVQMNYSLTSTESSWVLYFTYHHSSHRVVASLADISVPSIIQNLTAEAGDGNVTLSWDPPTYSNASNIVGYMISFGNSPDSLINQITVSQLVYVLDGLTKGQTYYFSVAAQNDAGWGPNSSTVSETPFGVPSIPLGFEMIAGNGNVTLNWSVPSYIGPGPITYHLFRDNILIWNGTAIMYLDMPLMKNVSYSYNVVVQNSIGWGSNSTVVMATPYGVPDAPMGLQVRGGNELVLMNWTSPSYSGPGTLTYHVFRDNILVWSGITFSYEDLGLVKGQSYSYKMCANNSVGWSPNTTTMLMAPFGVPSIPLGLESIVGDGNVTLNWTVPVYTGPGMLTYHLFRDGIEIWSEILTSHQDVGLTNGQTYEYQVAASNSVGWGANSTTVTAKPLGIAPTIVSHSPSSGAIVVPSYAVSVNFSEVMDQASVEFTGISGAMTWNAAGDGFAIAHAAFAYATTHTVGVTAKDLAGNSVTGSWTFMVVTQVTGTVNDDMGKQIVNATVTITQGTTVVQGVTDALGHFALIVDGVGTYNLTISATRFRDYVQNDLAFGVNQNNNLGAIILMPGDVPPYFDCLPAIMIGIIVIAFLLVWVFVTNRRIGKK